MSSPERLRPKSARLASAGWLAAVVLVLLAPASADPAPDVSELWPEALALLRDYRDRDAEPVLRTIVSAAPEHRQAHRELGLLLTRWHHYEEAEKHLSLYLATAPEPDAEALYARARMRFSLLAWASAAADVRQLLELSSGMLGRPCIEESRRLLEAMTRATPQAQLLVRDRDDRLLAMVRYGCSARRAEWYAEMLRTVFPQVEHFAGRPLPPVGLILLDDEDEADRWNEAYAGQEAPGCAFYNYRILILNTHADMYSHGSSADREAARATVLRHELAHHMVDEISGAHATPKWLHEGIAEHVAHGYLPSDDSKDVDDHLRKGRLPLRPEEFFLTADPEEMDMAFYAQAAGLVGFLTAHAPDGSRWITHYLQQRGNGVPTDEAFADATGMSKEAALQTWERSITR